MNCILVQGIPEGFDEGTIESTLEEHIAKEEGTYAVLCEFDKEREPLSVPKELEVAGNVCKIVTMGSQSSKTPTSDIGFLKKMTAFLEKEGKTMTDIPDLLGLSPLIPDQGTASLAGVWEKVLEKVLDKAMQPHHDSGAYRKLRLFSGSPTPIPGEEGFEPWLEYMTEMLQEWAVPNVEKRRRLIESLRGPALDVIRTLKLGDPGVSVKDCLEALSHAFGRNESADDIYCKFLSTKQKRGEKVSDYVQRLEKLLQRAVMRGAVAVERMDQARLAQAVRGVQHQDFILLHLRLRERQENPPSYSQLIKEIQEEEERQGTWENGENQPLEESRETDAGFGKGAVQALKI
uniref:Paraneoplastic antigen Ma-like C-terminal domain-containing protein n=1 Tax=Pelusios castaneus TaxID=367368 RepID=A0A8C8RDV0_9SAUR